MIKVKVRCLKNDIKGVIELQSKAATIKELVSELSVIAKDNKLSLILLPLDITQEDGSKLELAEKTVISCFARNDVYAINELDYDKMINQIKGEIEMNKKVNINKINNKEEFDAVMMDKNVELVIGSEEKATVEEWNAVLDQVAETIVKNGDSKMHDKINCATEDSILNAVEEALNKTGAFANMCGDKKVKEACANSASMLQKIKTKAKEIGWLNKLGAMLKRAWDKVWALIKGTGKFTMHVATSVAKHTFRAGLGIVVETIDLGKDIGKAFKGDIIDPVKRA